MQHFDNLDHYTDSDFDEYVYYSGDSKKYHYEDELKQFYFVYEDAWGDEQELFTTIECVWKVVPGSFNRMEESDVDYYGYTELTAWKVLSVENSEGEEINPEEVLTEKQLESYNTAMLNFVEGV